MSQQDEPSLSRMMVRYPFSPKSRRLFDKLPIEESFSSLEVQRQAQGRLLSAIGRTRYELHLSELIEFSSFFVAALIASQHQYLGQKFSERESERARRLFIEERPPDKPGILSECFEVRLTPTPSEHANDRYAMNVEDYLAMTGRFELNSARWRLINQTLSRGVVYFSENAVNDLFGDLSGRMIYTGVKNLKRVQFPKQFGAILDGIVPYLPAPKARQGGGKGYLYIDELLKNPVADGRHRLTWLVLAPYLVNVKNLDEQDAIERIRGFVAAKGETSPMKRFIEYNVKRAKRNGLMPPTLSKLRAEHPDLYELLPKQITRKSPGPSTR